VPFVKVPGSAGVQVGLMGFGGTNLGDQMGLSILISKAESF
jgi:hypothetical protein